MTAAGTKIQEKSFVSEAFATTATVTFDATATKGNLLMAWCVWDKNCGAITVPTGFTEIGTQHNDGPRISGALAYKISDGTETSFTSTCANAGVSKPGLCVQEYYGIDGAIAPQIAVLNYVDDLDVSSRSTGTQGPTTRANVLALAAYFCDTMASMNTGSGHAWTNGFTENFRTASATASGNSGMSVGAKILSATGTVETTFSYSGGTPDQAMAVLVAFALVNPVKHGLSEPAAKTSAKFAFELTDAATDAQVDVLNYATEAVVASSTPDATDGEKILQATVTGLTANTRYKWRVTTERGTDPAFTGSFYTNWDAGTSVTYDIGLVSDNQINSNDFTTYPRVAAFSPRYVVSVGDHPYIDETANTPATFRSKYRTLLQNASWRSLADFAAYSYIYDDHDFGGNNADASSSSAPAVLAEYARFFPVTSLPVSGTMAHSFVMGRVRHIVPDLRVGRVPATPVIMSSTQLQWVKDELTAAHDAQQVVILHSSSPWNVAVADVATYPDSWAKYPTERTAIMDHIQTLGMQASVMVHHADAHMLAYDDGTNTKYSTDNSFGLPTVCAAAVTQTGSTKGGPWSGGTNAGDQQYGRLTITEDSDPEVTIRIRLVDDADADFVDETIVLTPADLPSSGSAANCIGAGAGF